MVQMWEKYLGSIIPQICTQVAIPEKRESLSRTRLEMTQGATAGEARMIKGSVTPAMLAAAAGIAIPVPDFRDLGLQHTTTRGPETPEMCMMREEVLDTPARVLEEVTGMEVMDLAGTDH